MFQYLSIDWNVLAGKKERKRGRKRARQLAKDGEKWPRYSCAETRLKTQRLGSNFRPGSGGFSWRLWPVPSFFLSVCLFVRQHLYSHFVSFFLIKHRLGFCLFVTVVYLNRLLLCLLMCYRFIDSATDTLGGIEPRK